MDRREFASTMAHDAIGFAKVFFGAVGAIREVGLELAGGVTQAPQPPSGQGSGQPSMAQEAAQPPVTEGRGRSPWGRYEIDDMDGCVLSGVAGDEGSRTDVRFRDGADLTRVIRLGVIRGGPWLAPMALRALAGTADQVETMDVGMQENVLEATSRILAALLPASAALEEGLAAARSEWIEPTPQEGRRGTALRSLAGTLEEAIRNDSAALASQLATWIRATSPSSAQLLVHGESDLLSFGERSPILEGVALAAIDGTQDHVTIPQGTPTSRGQRMSLDRFAAEGISTSLIADTEIGQAIASGTLTAILVPADRIEADGTALAPLGSYALAVVAARHAVPFVVCVNGISVRCLPVMATKRRPARPAVGLARIEEVPAELISVLITEQGAL